MKVYGHPVSTCTRKVLMTLAETNTPHEFVTVDLFKGEHKQEAHLARQPFGQIPTLEDGDFSLFESRAICRYINDQVNGSLVPRDAKERAEMEQWISIETSNFTTPVMKFIYHYIFQRAQTPEVLETATQQLNTALSVMERQLAKHPFVAGSSFTLADICFMPYVEYAMGTPVKEIIAKYPHVVAWWNKVSEMPNWRKIVGRAA